MTINEQIRAAEGNQLFLGLKFWVSQRCPTRSEFIKTIEHLGGEIVPLEKQADKLIVDHLRKENPEGSISYQWIEHSFKKGELQPPKDYLQGPSPSASRVVSRGKPAKLSRTLFSAEDDKVLWNWVQRSERSGRGASGNEIYKELERQVSD